MNKKPSALRTIGETASLVGVDATALRYWEKCIPAIKLSRHCNRRYYSPDMVQLLKSIAYHRRELGYSIEGVRKQIKRLGINKFIQQMESEYNAESTVAKSISEAGAAKSVVDSGSANQLLDAKSVPTTQDAIQGALSSEAQVSRFRQKYLNSSASATANDDTIQVIGSADLQRLRTTINQMIEANDNMLEQINSAAKVI